MKTTGTVNRAHGRFLGLWVLALLVALAGCHRTPDDVAIRNAIADMTKAIETRNYGSFLTHVSEHYVDHDGRDIRGLRQLLLASFLQNRNIVVFVSNISIELRDGRADVNLNARLTSGEQLLADRRFGSYRVHTLWQREGHEWHVYEAEWEPLSEAQ
jgi:hypothetical protein